MRVNINCGFYENIGLWINCRTHRPLETMNATINLNMFIFFPPSSRPIKLYVLNFLSFEKKKYKK